MIAKFIVYLFLLWAMISGQRELDAIKQPIILEGAVIPPDKNSNQVESML